MKKDTWLTDLLEFYTASQKKEIIKAAMIKFNNDQLLEKINIKKKRELIHG